MICPPHPPAPVVRNWIERHRHPVSFVLHMFGIPPTIVGVLLIPLYLGMFSFAIFVLAVASFVGGYLLQFLGHAIDHSEPGEITFFRKRLTRRLEKIAAARRGRQKVPA